MNAAISVAVIVALATSAVSGSAQERMDLDGPIHRAITREASRLADEKVPSVSDGARQGRRHGSADWSHVRDLEAGQEIILSVKGSPPSKRYVIGGTVDEFGLTVLNLTSPAVPTEVIAVLVDAASWHTDPFGRAQRGGIVPLNRHVRLAVGGVFVDDRKVIELDQVVEHVTRKNVTEISVAHSATKRGMAWGALMGSVAGVAIMTASCGTNWSERSGCGNLTGIWLFFGPLIGFGIGAGVGATSKISTVVYHAP